MTKKKIAIVVNNSWYAWNMRANLGFAFQKVGFEVVFICPYDKYSENIKEHFDTHFKGKTAKEIDELAKDMDLSLYDGVRYMNNREREACQNIPSGYTDSLTQNEAACILGDGWTVDVIAHILKGIK